MSKYLKKVIEEMGNYSDMGMPDGEGSMGMGSVGTVGMRGAGCGDKKIKAYKLNDLLRTRNRAEEEEGLEDIDPNAMDDEMGMNDENGTEELKQFFISNPEPADEEIATYAEDHGMDLQEMRSAVYALIQSLLGDEEGMDDEMDMGDEEDMDFSVSGDTGEKPASNEMGSRPRV